MIRLDASDGVYFLVAPGARTAEPTYRRNPPFSARRFLNRDLGRVGLAITIAPLCLSEYVAFCCVTSTCKYISQNTKLW